jgi:hypothetical protein
LRLPIPPPRHHSFIIGKACIVNKQMGREAMQTGPGGNRGGRFSSRNNLRNDFIGNPSVSLVWTHWNAFCLSAPLRHLTPTHLWRVPGLGSTRPSNLPRASDSSGRSKRGLAADMLRLSGHSPGTLRQQQGRPQGRLEVATRVRFHDEVAKLFQYGRGD